MKTPVASCRLKVASSSARFATWNFQPATFNGTLAFTLIELLVVIAIIGVLVGISIPTLNHFKPNPVAVATRQLLDGVARARQLAIVQRTTVYMVFVNTNFWNDTRYATLPASELPKATNLFDKQLTGFNFVVLRTVGDQPGGHTARYLSQWRTLAEGAYIPEEKFSTSFQNQPVMTIYTNGPGGPVLAFRIFPFSKTNNIPFPSDQTPASLSTPSFINVPYIAFNYLGQITSGQNELIPVSQGSVGYARAQDTKLPIPALPSVRETPAGNTSNSYNIVSIDWLTGRAHIERLGIQ